MNRSGVVRCLLAALLFGASAPAASELAAEIPAITLAGLLYLGAGLAVLPSSAVRPPSRTALQAEWRPALVAVVIGGGIGPVLLVTGLARTSAATASILLNTELAATTILAAVVFREHLGGRLVASAATISVAGALLVATPSTGIDIGALLVIGACVCWGYDNGVTAQIEQLRPDHVVFLKGVVAGSANLVIGGVTAGVGDDTNIWTIVVALAIGAAGYGLSITLWVLGARDLGAARAQVIFSTAPFVGVVLSWAFLGDAVERLQLVAVGMAAVGVVMSLGTDHRHRHAHGAFSHEHEHLHPGDDHHVHDHPVVVGRHSHPHRHTINEHEHSHVPDLHHRHEHRG